MGRALRSKACQTCRKRRVKCDEERPFCRRCRVANFVCQGYPPAVQFVPYEPGERLSPSPSLSQSSSKSLTPTHIIPRIIAPVRDETLFVPFLEETLFRPAYALNRPNFWADLNSRHRPASLAHLTLSAMSYTFFGAVHGEESVLRRGKGFYVEGVRAVRRSLMDGGDLRKGGGDLLIAVYILGTYEMMFSTEPGAWIQHGVGLGTLFRIRGPRACRDPDVFDIFLTTRFLLILTALATEETSFLAQQEWRIVPFELQNHEKDHMDRLLDIVTELPGLRKDVAQARNGYGDGLTEVESVHARAVSLNEHLQSWCTIWLATPESQTSSKPCEPGGLDNNAHTQFFSSNLVFANLLAANIWTIYHATHCLLVEALVLSSDPTSLAPGETSSLYWRLRESAVDICRSVAYHMGGTHGNMGHFFILWPLRVAWRTLGQSRTVEGQWVEQTLQSIVERKWSWDVAKEVLSLEPRTTDMSPQSTP